MRTPAILVLGLTFTAACLVPVLHNSRMHKVAFGDGKIRYELAGNGEPTVILEPGLGCSMDSVDPIFDDIAAHTRVFAYDRPGYGESDPTARPRTPEQAVIDLRELLRRTGVNPPYVVVGHSLGGIYMLEFAHRFPADTVGVVLVDAPHPDLGARLSELGVKTKIPEAQYWKMPDHIRREYDGAVAAKLAGDLGDIPLIVMVAGDTLRNAVGPMFDKTESELAELSTNGRRVVVEDSNHLMLRDVPDQVTACVLDVLKQARDRSRK